jgi:hypothetical protein
VLATATRCVPEEYEAAADELFAALDTVHTELGLGVRDGGMSYARIREIHPTPKTLEAFARSRKHLGMVLRIAPWCNSSRVPQGVTPGLVVLAAVAAQCVVRVDWTSMYGWPQCGSAVIYSSDAAQEAPPPTSDDEAWHALRAKLDTHTQWLTGPPSTQVERYETVRAQIDAAVKTLAQANAGAVLGENGVSELGHVVPLRGTDPRIVQDFLHACDELESLQPTDGRSWTGSGVVVDRLVERWGGAPICRGAVVAAAVHTHKVTVERHGKIGAWHADVSIHAAVPWR